MILRKDDYSTWPNAYNMNYDGYGAFSQNGAGTLVTDSSAIRMRSGFGAWGGFWSKNEDYLDFDMTINMTCVDYGNTNRWIWIPVRSQRDGYNPTSYAIFVAHNNTATRIYKQCANTQSNIYSYTSVGVPDFDAGFSVRIKMRGLLVTYWVNGELITTDEDVSGLGCGSDVTTAGGLGGWNGLGKDCHIQDLLLQDERKEIVF